MTRTEVNDSAHFLRRSVRANALFSGLSGLSFVVANAPISAVLGEIPSLWVAGVGVQLMIFAAGLLWLASRAEISASLAMAVIVADLLWVLGTGVAAYMDLFARSGEILALLLADVVLVLAVFQSIGVRRMIRDSPRTALR